MATGHAALQPLFAQPRPLANQGYCLGSAFAQALLKHNSTESVGLIVNALGGSRIEWWQPPIPGFPLGEPLYHATVVRWEDAQKPKLAGILWHQGESNATDPHYYHKAMALFTSLRQDLGQKDVPIILGHIGDGAVINPQIDHVAQSLDRAAVVSVEGLDVFDGEHYDRDSTIELGKRYAHAYLNCI